MSIKKISDYTLEECQEYIKLNPNGSERIVVEERIRNIFTQSKENKEKDEILRKIKQEELEKDVEWIDIKRLIDKNCLKDLYVIIIIIYLILSIVLIFLGYTISLDGTTFLYKPSSFIDFCEFLGILDVYSYSEEWHVNANFNLSFVFWLIAIFLPIRIIINCFHTPSLNTIYNIELEEKVKSFRRTMDKRGYFGLHKCCRFRLVQILPFQYNNIYHCCENAYICVKEGKRGVYNTVKKKMVIEVDYDSIEILSDGTLKTLKNGVYSKFTTEGYRIIE